MILSDSVLVVHETINFALSVSGILSLILNEGSWFLKFIASVFFFFKLRAFEFEGPFIHVLEF